MILKKIKLHNIRSYKQEEINFTDGITLLSGDIGAGKSTILLAIEFALFGMSRKTLTGDLLLRHGKHEGSVELHFSLKLNKRINPVDEEDSICKDNSMDKNESAQKYTEIIIMRNLRRGNNVKQESGYIIIDNVKTECTPVELKSKVIELLGYPQDMINKATDVIYRYTVYTPQEEMKQILFENSNTRLETLRKVFDIDKYKRINENMNVVMKDMKTKRSELIGKTSDLEQKKVLVEEMKTQINAFEIKNNELNRQLEVIKSSVSKKRIEIEESEKRIKEINEIKNQHAIYEVKLKNFTEQKEINEGKLIRLKEQITKLEEDITNFRIIKPEEINKDNLEQELRSEERNLEQLKEKKINLTKEIEFNNSKINEISTEIQENRENARDIVRMKSEIELIESKLLAKNGLLESIEKIEKEFNEIDILKKEKDIEIKNSLKVKKDITSLDNCPLCLQDIKSDHKDKITFAEDKKIRKYNELLTQIEIERRDKIKEKNNLLEKLEQLREKDKQLEKLRAEFKMIEEFNKSLEKKQKILEELVKVRNKLNEEIADINNKDPQIIRERINHKRELLEKIRGYEERLKQKKMLDDSYEDKNKEMTNIKEEIERLEKDIDETKEKSDILEIKLKEHKDVHENYQIIKSQYDEILKQERSIELEIAGLIKQIESLVGQMELLGKEIIDKELSKEKITKINNMLAWSDEFFMSLMRSMEKHIMMRLYQEFNDLFVKWFDTLIEEENLSAKLDDEFTPVIIQNGYETTLHNLSGGERSAVALAYRLALNKVINSFITTINTKDIIILDEPTDGFSQEQLDKIKDVLDELSIKQIILVSHESKIESFAENIVRIAKSEHVSVVV
ncbi:MAG: SMC family ATPase [Candidatus Woesearchaeota archaeon]